MLELSLLQACYIVHIYTYLHGEGRLCPLGDILMEIQGDDPLRVTPHCRMAATTEEYLKIQSELKNRSESLKFVACEA